jgi:hypothetical protein
MSLLKALNRPIFAHLARLPWARSVQTSPANSLKFAFQPRHQASLVVHRIGTRNITRFVALILLICCFLANISNILLLPSISPSPPCCLPSSSSACSMTLESSKIIGDVVDHVKKTNIKMDVKYKYDHVENGVTMKPEHVSEI